MCKFESIIKLTSVNSIFYRLDSEVDTKPNIWAVINAKNEIGEKFTKSSRILEPRNIEKKKNNTKTSVKKIQKVIFYFSVKKL